MIKNEKQIALLIDAENTSLNYLTDILTEISKQGNVIVKRAYGDWSSPCLKNWKRPMNELAVQPVQQFSYTQGKNSSDAAMIIDAMDLLYSGRFNTFALVSSDSDFTKLATRLKESQIFVLGVGAGKTPTSLKNACDNFIQLEDLKAQEIKVKEKSDNKITLIKPVKSPSQQTRQQLRMNTKLISMLRNAIEEGSNEDGWAALSTIGSLLKKQYAEFDSRHYGYGKLSKLIQETGLFDLKNMPIKGSKGDQIFFRDNRNYKNKANGPVSLVD